MNNKKMSCMDEVTVIKREEASSIEVINNRVTRTSKITRTKVTRSNQNKVFMVMVFKVTDSRVTITPGGTKDKTTTRETK